MAGPAWSDGFVVSSATADEVGWQPASRFHYEHYLALGWIEANAHGVVIEYEAWNQVASFHGVRSGDDIVGTLRTIPGTYVSLPVGLVAAVPDAPAGEQVEFASLVTSRGGHAARTAEFLYRSAFQWTVQRRAAGIVALVDDWFLRLMRDGYAIPFAAIGPAQPYLGTQPLPIHVSLVDLTIGLATDNPAFWEFLRDGLEVNDRHWLDGLAVGRDALIA